MLSKSARYILVLTVATITAFANAQTSQPARTFNSTLKLDVHAEEINPDGFIVDKLLGKTPSAKPIAIPHGAKWSVRSNSAALHDVGLRAICKEMLDQNIPGLKISRRNKITDAGLAHLKGLTKLERLDLEDCVNITDAGLARLKGLTTLEHLGLWSCYNITDAGLAHLKVLTKLERLDLLCCDNITDAGLAHLKELTKLGTLKLSGCDKITDAGLVHLKGLTKLEQLDLSCCDKITKAGIAELKKALPNMSISH
ncbi:MAG: hypothetical protein GY794_05175 [bacterium]|nr:hypothetical protein [bacterium]